MKKQIKNILMVTAALVWGMVFTSPVYAGGKCTGGVGGACNPICSLPEDETDPAQREAAGCGVDANDNVGNHVVNIINTVISILGILGVIMIVFAGQRLITANGNPAQIAQSKNMILWAVVGIIIGVLTWAIINFAVGALSATA